MVTTIGVVGPSDLVTSSCRIIGDRVALLADGRIAHDGPVADMDRAPALAGFLGIPSAGVGDHAR